MLSLQTLQEHSLYLCQTINTLGPKMRVSRLAFIFRQTIWVAVPHSSLHELTSEIICLGLIAFKRETKWLLAIKESSIPHGMTNLASASPKHCPAIKKIPFSPPSLASLPLAPTTKKRRCFFYMNVLCCPDLLLSGSIWTGSVFDNIGLSFRKQNVCPLKLRRRMTCKVHWKDVQRVYPSIRGLYGFFRS